MDYSEHKKYFEIAYKTGSDIWTHIPIENRGSLLTKEIPKGSMVLDIGSGRGLFAKKLAESGYSVIGLDFEKNIVEKTNKEIKNWGLGGKLKFVVGDALDLPFTDNSFDGIFDFGLIENLYEEDWPKYVNEINRVLKNGGFYLNTSLSRETLHFFEFSPKNSNKGDFEKYGIKYHFFKKDEMNKIFDHNLTSIKQNIKFLDRPNDYALLETLFKKNK